MPLHVMRLTTSAVLPTRAHPNDAGADLYALEDITIPPMERRWVKTGIAVAIDPGKVGLVRPRSSMAAQGITVDAGVIDADYRGEVKVLLVNLNQYFYGVQHGDKIAQLLIMPVNAAEIVEVDSLNKTERGSGGFGSTGDRHG